MHHNRRSKPFRPCLLRDRPYRGGRTVASGGWNHVRGFSAFGAGAQEPFANAVNAGRTPGKFITTEQNQRAKNKRVSTPRPPIYERMLPVLIRSHSLLIAMRLLVILTIAVPKVGAVANSTNGLAPAESFKEFVKRPPIIADLTCVFELWDMKLNAAWNLTNYIRIRYKPDAMFLARCESPLPSPLPPGNDLDIDGSIVSSFSNRYWYRYHTDLYAWTNRNVPQENGNVVDWNYHDKMSRDVARVLNMGCDHVPVGSIRWKGDTFLTTNQATETIVRGTLSRDEKGRAASLTVELKPAGKTLQDTSARVITYEYSYDTPFALPWFPSTISMKPNVNESAEQYVLAWRLKILGVQLASTPLPESFFSLLPYNGTNVRHVFFVSNRFLTYFDGRQWRATLDSQHLVGARERVSKIKRLYRIVAFVLFFLVPPVVFWLYRKSGLRKPAMPPELKQQH